MRLPTDMPQPRRFSRGRIALIVVVGVVFALFMSLRGLAGFWTDWMWFDSLGLGSVFTGILGAKIALGAIFTVAFFVMVIVNLVIADRIAPKVRETGPEDDLLDRYHATIGRRTKTVRVVVSLVLALFVGLGMSGEWKQWILFRNGGSFGLKDQTFNTDVGFYVFKLPFYSSVTNWLFASGIIILIVTLVAHYLNGGIRFQTQGQRVTPQVKAHISVGLGLLALVKAADYWLQRYALTYSTRGTVDGATYTDVKAQLPVIYLLLFIALLSFGLFIANIWRRGWTLPVVAVGLWALVSVIAGVGYPAFIQRFVVEPEESTRESPYIQHNIDATRAAMGLSSVDTQPFLFNQDKVVATQSVNDNPGTIRNIRLLDPIIVEPTYQRLQSQYSQLRFNELDVDRYPIKTPSGDIASTQVIIGTRDLNVDQIPQGSWEGKHFAYTHGYGVALAPANATTTQGRPDFLIRNVPQIVDTSRISAEVSQPQLYYGENVLGYAITNASREEIDYVQADGQTKFTQYSGSGGVRLDSFIKKAAYGLKFSDWNLVVSKFLNSDSRIVYQRDVRQRIEAVAPFMQFDSDPYPVIQGGRVVYIFDGYTTTDRYPNAQRADSSGLAAGSDLGGKRFNYIRNSVKGVVDTYDGTVKLYVVDPSDPIVNAYQKAFPALFVGVDEMPAELKAHWRYPEDLFRTQTNSFGRYHISDPKAFYEKTSSWSVAQDPGSTVNGSTAIVTANQTVNGTTVLRTKEARISPVYSLIRLPGQVTESFVMLRPFVPYSEDDSKKTLTSFMVANSDPAQYGKLTVYEMPSGFNIDGPAIVNANILSDPEVAKYTTLLDQQGSRVQFGALMMTPVNNSIIYVRPLYVSSDNNTQIPELKQVIVVFGGQVVMKPTLREALQTLFPGANPQTFESSPVLQDDTGSNGSSGGGASSSGSATTTTIPSTGNATKDQLIDQAAKALTDADAALRSGNLAEYQAKVREAQNLINQAQALPNGTTSSSGSSGSSTTTPTTVMRSGTPA
ncbi:MAG: UPF0182 family protein [Actinomycetota bacterium]